MWPDDTAGPRPFLERPGHSVTLFSVADFFLSSTGDARSRVAEPSRNPDALPLECDASVRGPVSSLVARSPEGPGILSRAERVYADELIIKLFHVDGGQNMDENIFIGGRGAASAQRQCVKRE